MFLLDTLDNLPRLRVSDSLMKVFLWILQEGDAKDVPSFYQLRRMQEKLKVQCGIPTTLHTSPIGNVFHINDPRSIIANVGHFDSVSVQISLSMALSHRTGPTHLFGHIFVSTLKSLLMATSVRFGMQKDGTKK